MKTREELLQAARAAEEQRAEVFTDLAALFRALEMNGAYAELLAAAHADWLHARMNAEVPTGVVREHALRRPGEIKNHMKGGAARVLLTAIMSVDKAAVKLREHDDRVARAAKKR